MVDRKKGEKKRKEEKKGEKVVRRGTNETFVRITSRKRGKRKDGGREGKGKRAKGDSSSSDDFLYVRIETKLAKRE